MCSHRKLLSPSLKSAFQNTGQKCCHVFCIYIPKKLINSLYTLVEDNHGSVHMFSVLLPCWIQPLGQWKSWDEGTGKYLSSSPPTKDTVIGKSMCITDTQIKDLGHQQQIFELINFLGPLFFFFRSLPAEPVQHTCHKAPHPFSQFGTCGSTAALPVGTRRTALSSLLFPKPDHELLWSQAVPNHSEWSFCMSFLLGMGPHLSPATWGKPR